VTAQRSLRRQLLLWLVLPQLILWLAGGAATYRLAAGYANQAIDASLLLASRALARQVKPLGNGLLIDFPRAAQDVLQADPDDPLVYMVSTPPGRFILGNNRMPPPPVAPRPALLTPVFYDGQMQLAELPDAAPQRVRVAALYLNYGEPGSPPQTMMVQVARSSANREELARNILVDTLLPLSGLVLLMTMIVWAGIRAGLAPLGRLRREVEGRAPNDLAPIRLEEAPRELHSLATALNQLLAAVRSNVESQKRFIADAAHQLRTPLAGLKSQTELALQSNRDPEMQARLERVHASATRSAHLVNQLLTLARAEPESATAQDRSSIDLRRFAQEIVADQVPRALRAGVDLGLDDIETVHPVTVRANALLLREAVLNLIDNAIRYAGPGAEVTLRVERDGVQARLDVADNGPGIAPQDRERVFERFVRATEAGDGCGLGLAIVQEIVQRHGGSVQLEAVVPHGTRVVVRLPLG
jgi:two-component system sensor histidine kinase TctE